MAGSLLKLLPQLGHLEAVCVGEREREEREDDDGDGDG